MNRRVAVLLIKGGFSRGHRNACDATGARLKPSMHEPRSGRDRLSRSLPDYSLAMGRGAIFGVRECGEKERCRVGQTSRVLGGSSFAAFGVPSSARARNQSGCGLCRPTSVGQVQPNYQELFPNPAREYGKTGWQRPQPKGVADEFGIARPRPSGLRDKLHAVSRGSRSRVGGASHSLHCIRGLCHVFCASVLQTPAPSLLRVGEPGMGRCALTWPSEVAFGRWA